MYFHNFTLMQRLEGGIFLLDFWQGSKQMYFPKLFLQKLLELDFMMLK